MSRPEVMGYEVYDTDEELRRELSNRMIEALSRMSGERLPDWFRHVRHPTESEARLGYTVVVETVGKDIPLRVVASFSEMEDYNLQFPRNGQMILVLHESYSTARIVDKSLRFLEEEFYK